MAKKKKKLGNEGQVQKLSVLFVCTGNTCRSPMAEVSLRELVRAGELEHRIRVSSAGLMAHGGSPASANSVAICADAGLDLTAHVSRLLNEEIMLASDIIVCIQREHARVLERLEQSKDRELLVLGSFSQDTDKGQDADISDPFGGDLGEYLRTFQVIESCMPGLLEYLKKRLERSFGKGMH